MSIKNAVSSLVCLILVFNSIIAAASKTEPVSHEEYTVFTKARKHLAHERMDQAETMLAKYFQRNGRKHSIGYELYGYLLMNRKKTTKAITVLEDGIRYYPQNGILAQNLGTAYGQKGNNFRAAEMFLKANELFSQGRPQLAFTASVFFLRAKKYNRAIEVLQPIVALSDSKLPWHKLQGMCYLESKQYKAAVNTLKKSLKRFPESPQLWRMLGFAYHQMGDMNRSAATYEIAYRLKPPTAKEAKQLIGLYCAIGAPHLGERLVEKSMATEPKVLDNLAWGLARSGNLQGALKKIDEALQKESTPDRRFRRGVILMRMDRKAEARKAFMNLAERKNKIGAKANWALAMISWTEEDWPDVLRHLKKAEQANPKFKKRAKRLQEIVKGVLDVPFHDNHQ